MGTGYPRRNLWSARKGVEDPLAFLQSLASDGGEVVPFTLGRRTAFLLNHPVHVENVLVRDAAAFDKGRGYQRAARLMGNGLLTASGSHHAERRRLTQAAFHVRYMPAYRTVIVTHASKLSDQWRQDVPIDVAEQMRELALGIAGEALFGVDLTCKAHAVRRAVAEALPAMDGLLAVVAGPRHASAGARELRSIVSEIIETRQQSPADRDDLLALMISAADLHDESAMRQLRDDALTFLLAGHDTVAHALTWTWTLLAEHEDVAARLAEELSVVLNGRLPTAADLSLLTFTRAVFAEAMRLFPPAWVIVRRSTMPYRLGNIEAPTGSIVVASPFLMHRDSRFFREPSRFDPTRWVGSDQADRRKLAYFPFGAGPRSCVGEGFAWMEGTLVLATLAQRWRLTRADDSPRIPVPKITLRVRGPVMLRPELRD
jgi:cytochrome P450